MTTTACKESLFGVCSQTPVRRNVDLVGALILQYRAHHNPGHSNSSRCFTRASERARVLRKKLRATGVHLLRADALSKMSVRSELGMSCCIARCQRDSLRFQFTAGIQKYKSRLYGRAPVHCAATAAAATFVRTFRAGEYAKSLLIMWRAHELLVAERPDFCCWLHKGLASR